MGQAQGHIPTSATWKGPPWDQLIQPCGSIPGEGSGGKGREVRKGKQGGKERKRAEESGEKETGEREMRKGKLGKRKKAEKGKEHEKKENEEREAGKRK